MKSLKHHFRSSIAILCLSILTSAVFAQQEVPLFNGNTLEGWQTLAEDKGYWRAENGALIGDSNGKAMPRSSYLWSERKYEHFEFRCQFKLTGDPKTGVINSGIQFRTINQDGAPVGYQADIGGPDWWGGIFEESKGVRLAEADMGKILPLIKENDWNEYLIRANGPIIQLFINGTETVNYLEKIPSVPYKGHFAIQLHKGGICKIEMKDLTLVKLDGGIDPSNVQAWGAAKQRITYQELQVSKIPQTAEKELESFELPNGFVAELVAQESEGIGKFVAVDFDSSGKMWSMTALDYPVDAKREKTKAQNLFKNGGKDKLLVFDNPTAAGVQTPRVFATKLAIPLGAMPYKNGAIAQYGGDIRHYQDTNGDGKADKYEVLLTGFGIEDSHLFPHQFTRGPGGWMHLVQGLANYSAVQRPDGSAFVDGQKSIKYDRCRMARMKLDGSRFQYTTTGPNNVWGLVTGRTGEWFIQEANDKGYPVVPYDFGIYMNTGGTAKIKPYQPLLPPIFKTAIMGGTGLSGLALAQDINSPFAKEGKRTFYLANPLTSSIQIVTAKPLGNNRFQWEKEEDFLVAGDKWFRPIGARFGPDGALYVVDWYNKIIAHGEVRQNHPERDKIRGRIWRIRHKDQKRLAPPNLSKATDTELLKHLSDDNALIQRLTWLEMIDRNAISLLPGLKEIITTSTQRLDVRLAALWAYEGLGDIEPELLHALATDKEANMRAEVVRISGRTSQASDFAKIAISAADDEAVRVRSALGEALVTRLEHDADSMHAAAILGKAALTTEDRQTQYEREFERFLARWAMEKNPKATTAMLGKAADLPVENRLLAMQALKPEQAALAFLPMIPKLDRDLSTSELTLITGQLSQPKVLQGFKALLNDPARQRTMLLALSKADPSTSNKVLNSLLSDACRQLIKRDNTSSNRTLVMQVAQRHRLIELESDIGLWTSKEKEPQTIIAGLRCLRELGPVDAALSSKLIGHADESVQREAIIALSTAVGSNTVETVAKHWSLLSATDRQSAIDGLMNSQEKAIAFGQAVIEDTYGELDSGTLEKLVIVLDDNPLAEKILKKLGDSVPMVIRLSGGKNDHVDSNLKLTGAFTIETWVRISGKKAITGSLLSSKKSGQIGFSKGKLQVSGSSKKTKNLVVSKATATAGQWTHYAIVRDETNTFKIFIDGVLDSKGKKTFAGDFTDFDLGASLKGDGLKMEFLEFRVWKNARDENAILEGMQISYTEGNQPAELAHRFSGDTANLPLQGKARIAPASDSPTLITAAKAAEIAATFKKYRAIVSQPGNVDNGKIMFQQTCTACHMVKNVGGRLGPDLSGAGTTSDEGLLRNILLPNAALEASYYRHDLKLKDGSFISGFMVSENKAHITIRLIGADDKVISKALIDSHSISKRSLMPEGLVSAMTDQQVADLFSYLRTLK